MVEESRRKSLSVDYANLEKRLNAGIKMGNAQSYVVDSLMCNIKNIERCVNDPEFSFLVYYQGEIHGFITALGFCRKISDDLYSYLLSNFYYI